MSDATKQANIHMLDYVEHENYADGLSMTSLMCSHERGHTWGICVKKSTDVRNCWIEHLEERMNGHN